MSSTSAARSGDEFERNCRRGTRLFGEWWSLLGCSVLLLIFASIVAALWCSRCDLHVKFTPPVQAALKEGGGLQGQIAALTLANLHWLQPSCTPRGLLFFDQDTTTLAMEFGCPGLKGLEGLPDYVLQAALSWGEDFRIIDRLPTMLTVEGVCKQFNGYFGTDGQTSQIKQWDFFFDRERNRVIVVFGSPYCTNLAEVDRDEVHIRVLEKAFYYAFFSSRKGN